MPKVANITTDWLLAASRLLALAIGSFVLIGSFAHWLNGSMAQWVIGPLKAGALSLDSLSSNSSSLGMTELSSFPKLRHGLKPCPFKRSFVQLFDVEVLVTIP